MTAVKICGLTNLEDARWAWQSGADLLGFVFVETSPRRISPTEAARVVRALAGEGCRARFVGVFANQPAEVVREVAAECALDLVQLHGDWGLDHALDYARSVGVPFILARRVRGDLPTVWAELSRYAGAAYAYLLDSYDPERLGGTGKVWGWDSPAWTQEGRPPGRIMVAGGLTPDNVGRAIRALRPWGVDVSSGVEASPGRKDPSLVRRFIRQAKEAGKARPVEWVGLPDDRGYFGSYGGRYVPETLMAPLRELEEAYMAARADQAFQATLERLLRDYVGRPTPLTYAERLSRICGGAQIWLKREDLAHTGAHKINNALGQALLARRMGKTRLVAETGAGQHGVATATVAALFGFECVVYMGTDDMRRQRPNVARMLLLGAEVRGVDSGSRTLKDAVSEALRDWALNVRNSHYILGSALGPHPYPLMVRDFQSVIGREARDQVVRQAGRLPRVLIACVGGGSNSIGLFHAFLNDPVELIGVEAGGEGVATGRHAARFADPRLGRVGVLHGVRTYVLQDEHGQIAETHSVAAGLDYPSVGPEHSFLHDLGRVRYTAVADAEALSAFRALARYEGILPALESSHAVAEAMRVARSLSDDDIVLVNLSGRGDKDLDTVAADSVSSDPVGVVGMAAGMAAADLEGVNQP